VNANVNANVNADENEAPRGLAGANEQEKHHKKGCETKGA
jgi:hypothetical protein